MPKRDCILITGASGFLGTWISSTAHKQESELIGVDVVAPPQPKLFSNFASDKCEQTDFESLVGSRKVRAVFHLAGGASVPDSMDNPRRDFESLLPGTIALLSYLIRYQRDAHLVFYSSAAVYGNPASLPIAEGAKVKPVSPYGIHKAATEFIIEHYAGLFGLRSSLLRVFSAYGEGLRKQVVWDICQRMSVAQRQGEETISLHGTGTETRDFIHGADVARAALFIAEHPPKSGAQVVNVASGQETSIAALAECVARELNSDVKIRFNGLTRAGDPVNWRADISKLAALGFSPKVSFPEGIARCVQWQKDSDAQKGVAQSS